MVAIRGRTFKKPWQRPCLSSKLKSSSAQGFVGFHAVGSSNAPLLGSTAAEGLPRIGRTSIATHWRSCGLPQSASCSENFVIPPDVFGQTLSFTIATLIAPIQVQAQQYIPSLNCIMFPQNPNPGAELRYLLAHPNTRVCASPNPDLAGQARTLEEGARQRAIDTKPLMDAMSGRR